MRPNRKARIVTVAASVGAALGASWALLGAVGFYPMSIATRLPGGLWGSLFSHAVGGAVLCSAAAFAGVGAMDGIREVVKQLAVWLGVVVLLPLTAWYGTSAFSPPPDWKQHTKDLARLDEQIRESNSKADKDNIRQEKDRLDNELDAQERVYYQHMFWVAYPIGLAAFIVGTFLPVQSVGAGLMFGGLSSLATGCYSYWDRMGDSLRFESLVVALLIVVLLGLWRFRSAGPRPAAAS